MILASLRRRSADLTARGRLPNFILIGATKCGTTSLHAWLGTHPDVFMHPWKEMRFFNEEGEWHRGVDWYRAQFADAGDALAAGEASNGYTRHPVYAGAPERIARTSPDVRLVYLVREPMRRLESHYRHRLVTGMEWRPPDEAFRADPGYVAAGRYGTQLQRYLEHFPRERILVLQSERLFAEPGRELPRLAEHLGIPADHGVSFAARNETAHRPVAPTGLRRLSRFPAARAASRRLARTIGRSPLARLAPTADVPAYELSPDLRRELADLYEHDRRLLAMLAGTQAADWAPTSEDIQ
jgi:hypothetical protein